MRRRHHSAEFRKFLDTIDDAVPANLDTHETAPVRRWLAKRPRFHVHFTPCASWLPPVERFFAALAEKQIRRGPHRSVRELETAVKQDLAFTNEAPKPFVWTENADRIFET